MASYISKAGAGIRSQPEQASNQDGEFQKNFTSRKYRPLDQTKLRQTVLG